MSQVVDFLIEAKTYYFATVEGDPARDDCKGRRDQGQLCEGRQPDKDYQLHSRALGGRRADSPRY